jgi:hypothetical protein
MKTIEDYKKSHLEKIKVTDNEWCDIMLIPKLSILSEIAIDNKLNIAGIYIDIYYDIPVNKWHDDTVKLAEITGLDFIKSIIKDLNNE